MAEKGREIRDLLGKISHPLAEVRSRSLRSIVFKLSNGLLSYSQLAEEREFIAGLLEWFNQHEWTMESHVLTLLHQLAKYESGGRTLVSIGGVDFLSQLRGYCDPSLHLLIDDTLEQLLQISVSSASIGSSELGESGCSTSSFTSEMTTDMGSYHSQQQQQYHSTDATQTPPQDTPTHQTHGIVHHAGPYHLATTKHAIPSTATLQQFMDNREVWREGQVQVGSQVMSGVGNQYTAGSSSVPSEMLTSAQCGGRKFHFSYDENVESESQLYTGEERGELRGDIQATTRDDTEDSLFPWLRLTVKDCHTLATTQSCLLSPSPDTVVRSCQFLCDVLLEDFPPEVFLQRPSILKCLLQLCGQGVAGSRASHPALLCLLKLTGKLRGRLISLRRDHSMRFIDKLTLSVEDHGTLKMRPMPHGLPSQSHDQLEELAVEVLEQLQSEQVSLDQYCSSVIASTAPLLPGYLNKQLTWAIPEGEGQPLGGAGGQSVAAHLAVSMELLSAVVELMDTQRSVAGDKDSLIEVALLSKSIECLSSALSQCLSKWRRLGSSQGKGVSPLLQLVCCSTLQLAHSLSRLLQQMGLSEKGDYPWWTSCPSLGGVVQELMMSGVIGVTLPHLQDNLLPLFQLMDSTNARLFCKVKSMARRFQKMAQFLNGSAESDKSDLSLELCLAVDSLEGLWFTCNADFITKAVSRSIDVLSSAGVESVEWSRAKLLLVSLLSHGGDGVMGTAYQHFVKVLLDVVPGIDDHPAKINGDSPLHHILNDADILGQVCRYGAVSQSDTVAQLSRQLLNRLISQSLVQTDETSCSDLRELLRQWIPYIEVSAGEDSKLFEGLQKLVSDDGENDQQFQLQCCLRFLFSQYTELRVWSFSQLTRMIIAQTQHSDGQSTQTNFIQSSSPLHDLLATPTSTTVNATPNKSRSFQLEDVLKLRHILRSTTMDEALKKVALEQAAIILQDCSLHEQLMEEGFSDDLLGLLSPLFECPPPSPSTEGHPLISLATPSIHCISLLVGSSRSLRMELAANCKFLLGLYKVCLMNPKERELVHGTSKLLVSLLFDTVIRFGDDGPKLPSSIARRLKLPFPVGTYEDSVSSHSTPCPVDPGLLTSEPLPSMLRTHYHVALAGGVGRLINVYRSGDQQLLSSSAASSDDTLSVPSHDIKSLQCLQMRLPVDDLAALSSHQEVVKNMQLASVVVLCKPLSHGRVGYGTDWSKGVKKFLAVQPRTTKDVELLSSVLQFLTTLLRVTVKVHSSPQSSLLDTTQLVWLVNITCHEDAVCVQLVHSYLSGRQRSVQQRALLQSIVQYYATITDVVFGSGLVGVEELKGVHLVSLCEALCQCLEVAGSPDHHDLAVMETALSSIVNITSSSHLPVLIGHSAALLLKLIISLHQVLYSFNSDQGTALVSFMGKGIISQAALSLTHLAQSSGSFTLPQGWWSKWVSGTQPKSLSWLNSLLTDRDPKVRYAGYSLLTLFCGKAELVEVLVSHWSTYHPFGLWGLCLRTALDSAECVLVRQQAFFALANLSAVCSNERKWSELLSFSSEELSVNSGRALELLLERYKLFSLLLSNIKLQGLAQLKTKLQTSESAVLASNGDDPLPTELRHSSSDTVNRGDSQPREENSTPQLQVDATCQCKAVEGVTAACIECCSPYVISGWCLLVNNLLQTFPDLISGYVHNYCIVASLSSILEPLFLEQFFQKGIRRSIHCEWWLRMYSDAVDLLKTAVVLKPDSSLPLLTGEEVLLALGGILSVGNTCTGASEQIIAPQSSGYFHLCSSVLSLMQAMVHKSTPSTRQLIFSVLQVNWKNFIELLLYSFKIDPYLESLLYWSLGRHGLTLLNSLLVHCFQPGCRQGAGGGGHRQPLGNSTAQKALVTNMIKLLDGIADGDKVGEGSPTPSGAQLCSALLQAYEGISPSLPRERWLVGSSLGLLLSCSITAKQMALKHGLLEVLMEELKSLHTKLCMESLEDHTHHTRRSKENPTVDKLVAVVNLLRNFQHQSSEIKVACVKNGFPAVVHKMWPTCTVNRQILISVLKMLCTLTAQYPTGRASLAVCIRGSNCSLLQSILKTATHTLSSHTSCTSAKTPSPYSEILHAVFSLLANCALSHECRAVLKKTGLLTAFTSLNPKSEKPLPLTNTKHASVKLSSLWIKLLVNLSFSSDGQQMIMKQPESIDILLDVYSSNRDAQHNCLLVLRNLCFYGPSKTLLASNENFLSVMSSALDCWPGDMKRVSLAASALWALLYNSAKIRHSLRKAGLYDRLSDLQSSLQAETDSSDVNIERTSMAITQTLNIVAL